MTSRWLWRSPAPLRGVLRQRSRFYLAYRSGVRWYGIRQAAQKGRPGVVAAGAALSAAVDIGSWATIRRDDRLRFWSRLALDTVDMAGWALHVDGPPEAATLPAVPFAMEAGHRLGIAGFAVPLVEGAVTTVVRRWRGRPTSPLTFSWLAMATAWGNLTYWYEDRQRAAAVAQHRSDVAARVGAARLAAQNHVAMGADTVVDELARAEFLLATIDPEAVGTGTGRVLSEWKASLAASTSADAVYLGTALSRWQRRRYGSVLADDVVIEVAPGEGTTILSHRQAQQLEALLDGLPLKGPTRVTVETKRRVAVGDPLRLRAGETTVEVPADPRPVVRPFDPAPLVTLAGGLFGLSLAAAGHGSVPWPATLPGLVGAGAVSYWTHHRLATVGADASESVVHAAIGLALLQAVTATPFMRRPLDHEGVQVFPILMTLPTAAILIGRYRQSLSPPALLRLGASVVAATSLSLAFLRRPIQWGAFVIAAAELLAVYVSCEYVEHALEIDHGELLERLHAEEEIELEVAYRDGRQVVLDLVRETLDGAVTRLERVRDRGAIEPRLDGVIGQSIDDATTMFEAL